MKLDTVLKFFQLLDKPMGFGKDYKASKTELMEWLGALDLPTSESSAGCMVHFKDVLVSVSKKVFREAAIKRGEHHSVIDEEELDGISGFNEQWDKKQKSHKKSQEKYAKKISARSGHNLHHLMSMDESEFSAEQFFAARLIQAQIRGRLMSKEKARKKAEELKKRNAKASLGNG